MREHDSAIRKHKSESPERRTKNISLTNPHSFPHEKNATQEAHPQEHRRYRAPSKTNNHVPLESAQNNHNSTKLAQTNRTQRHTRKKQPAPPGATQGRFAKKPLSHPGTTRGRFAKKPLLLPGATRGRFAKKPSQTYATRNLGPTLRIGAACLMSALLLIGIVGLFNIFNSSSYPDTAGNAGNTGEPVIQNTMARKMYGIATEIISISQAVNSLKSDGYQVGFYTESINNGASLGYDENRLFYGASSIKGPFVLASLEHRGSIPASQRDNIEEAIVDSDNDAYFRLVQSFGIDTINAELASVDATNRLTSSDYFVNITPRQLCNLWKISYSYITSGTSDTTWLASLFGQTINSEIAHIEDAETWSKAGWIVDEGYYSTVDAGIVTRGNLSYCVSVMTDKGEDFDAIAPLVKSLDALEQYFA